MSATLPTSPANRETLRRWLVESVRLLTLGGDKQGRIAERLGVCPSTLSQWMSGERETPVGAALSVMGWVPSEMRAVVLATIEDSVWGITPAKSAEVQALTTRGAITLGKLAELTADGKIAAEEVPAAKERIAELAQMQEVLTRALPGEA